MTVFWVQREFEQGAERFLVFRSKKSSRQRRPKCVANASSPVKAWEFAREKARKRTGDAIYTELPDWVRLDEEEGSSSLSWLWAKRYCWMEKEI
jgi:hypothetical protein